LGGGVILKILTFVVLSYVIALVMDIAVLLFGLPGFLWGFARMWGVTLSVFICLVLYEESIPASFRRFLGFSKRSIILYFLAPLVVYAVFGLYLIISTDSPGLTRRHRVNATSAALSNSSLTSTPKTGC
jgi:hypothetical protein